jgi:hypothetical protein
MLARDPWFMVYGGPGHIVFREGVKDEGDDPYAAGASSNGGGKREQLPEPAELELEG